MTEPGSPAPGPVRPRLLLPEGLDPRVQEAARRIAAGGTVEPALLGAPRSLGDGVRLLEPDEVLIGELADWYADRRGVSAAVARRVLRRPEVLGAALVATGAADALVSGATASTHDVLVACESTFGLAPGATLASSFFLIETRDGRSFLFADCAVNPDPTAAQLAEIAGQTAASAASLFGWAPRVAMLSFSTHGSADHPAVEKVRTATELARRAHPDLAIDGEIQADAAVDPTAALHKALGDGPVAGRANVLIFPTLDAGNIAYKLVRDLGGARAVGVVLQGYAHAAADLSRGATVDEIVDTAALVAQLVRPPLPV